MKKTATILLASGAFIAATSVSFADQRGAEGLTFPWMQSDSGFSENLRARKNVNKVRPGLEAEKGAHWGKHHDHGIYLEGSDHPSRSESFVYD